MTSWPLCTAFIACDGSLMQISSNNALSSVIGCSFGGDGSSTFAMPDTREAENSLTGFSYYICTSGVYPSHGDSGTEDSNYILGTLILVSFNYGTSFTWRCDGRSLSISDNTALFSLIGTSYGGDGVVVICLARSYG